MSKKVLYCLAIGLTYATLDRGIFRAGVAYTPEKLGDYVDAKNDQGENYFTEYGGDVEDNKVTGEAVVPPAKTGGLKIKAPAKEEKASGTVGGVDPGKVTV